jgi:hypothetical protein
MSTNGALNIADNSVDGVLLWIAIFIVISIICVFLFENLRKRPHLKNIYYSKILLDTRSRIPIPKCLIEWIKIIYNTTHSTVEIEAGLDALIFLKFLEMCFTLLCSILLLMLLVVIPVNYIAAGRKASNSTEIAGFGISSFAYFSISNVDNGSNLLWVHLACAYIVSGLTYYRLFKTYEFYIYWASYRLLNPISPLNDLKNRTILIKYLPDELSTTSALQTYIEDLNIGDLESIHLSTVQNKDLADLIKEFESILRLIESTYMEWSMALYRVLNFKAFNWITLTKKLELVEHPMSELDQERSKLLQKELRPKIKQDGEVIDSLQHYIPKLMALKKQITEKRSQFYTIYNRTHLKEISIQQIYNDSKLVSPAAFVTFKSVFSVSIMKQALFSASTNLFKMEIHQAPNTDEIVWENLTKSVYLQKLLRWLISIGTFIICAIWIVPTYQVATLAVQGVPDIEKSNPNLAFYIQTLVPPILILISNSIMPYFLEYITGWQFICSTGEFQQELLKKYFYFLMFNVHFVLPC